ncbi:MAG: HNH endonuclease [Promicromonosporaceae bacterium]|nr:HNH endonuclease [Promicromonosporaceae bacterium]
MAATKVAEISEASEKGQACLRDVPFAELARMERALRRGEDRSRALRLAMLPLLDVEGSWALQGHRSFANWLARQDNLLPGQARREVRLAEVLREHLPATRAQALAGRRGAGEVEALVGICSSPAREAALRASTLATRVWDDEAARRVEATGEEHLLAEADRFNLESFRMVCRRFAQVVDPEADERGFREAKEREFLEMGQTLGGFHLRGFLDEESGLTLDAALRAIAGRPSVGETRTYPQRRAAALADLARLTLSNGLVGNGAAVRPHLVVHVSWDEYRRLSSRPADAGGLNSTDERWLSDPDSALGQALIRMRGRSAAFEGDSGPIPGTVLRRIACDAEVTRVVFGPDSQILNVGRAHRTVKGQLRRAVIARDGHCVFPDCGEPPNRCEVHHAVTHWADGGTTSTDNSALLCWHHHEYVDTMGVSMRWEGGWRFADRHGQPITRASLGGWNSDLPHDAA